MSIFLLILSCTLLCIFPYFPKYKLLIFSITIPYFFILAFYNNCKQYDYYTTVKLYDCYYDEIGTEGYRGRVEVDYIIRYNDNFCYERNATVIRTDDIFEAVIYKRVPKYKFIEVIQKVNINNEYKYEFYIPKSHRM